MKKLICIAAMLLVMSGCMGESYKMPFTVVGVRRVDNLCSLRLAAADAKGGFHSSFTIDTHYQSENCAYQVGQVVK